MLAHLNSKTHAYDPEGFLRMFFRRGVDGHCLEETGVNVSRCEMWFGNNDDRGSTAGDDF